jgi:hypothetical protein
VYVRSLVYATKEDAPAGWHEFSVEHDLTGEQLNRLRLGSMRCGVDNNVSLLDHKENKIL